MHVSITESAELDLQSISHYITRDNPSRARTFAAELREFCLTTLVFLRHTGKHYEPLPPNTLSKPFGNYRILYVATEHELVVTRVLHGNQLLHRNL